MGFAQGLQLKNSRKHGHDHSILNCNSSVVIPRMSSMKQSVISGELVVQRKLRSVSSQGEKKKKRSEMMEGKEGRQSWWMGGGRWGAAGGD